MSSSMTVGLALLLPCLARAAAQDAAAPPAVVVPRLWAASALADWATPVAGLNVAPSFVSEEAYYAAPVDNLRTYPVYHPDREPPGYREALLAKGPQPLIEPEKLHTPADWIAAGHRVFQELDTALSRTDDPTVIAHFTSGKDVDAFRDASHDAISADGVLLDYRWVVDARGKLEISFSSCASCHTRLMPDGSLLEGAPCNYDIGDSPAADRMLDQLKLSPTLTPGEDFYAQFGVPWRPDDPHARFRTMPAAELHAFHAQDDGAPAGTLFARFNGSPLFPTRMADLRGLRDKKYLDSTGTHRNRGPADIARYGILVEFADAAVFGPHHLLPRDAEHVAVRPPDAAMYAMALFLDSLDPAPSPHALDDTARRGQQVFTEQGCASCHAPPLYTSNKLLPVTGYAPSPELVARLGDDLSPRHIDTDPGLALLTRKGTGCYRVPTLRGLWYRGLYGHSGFVTSLEDWFDARRLQPDYVPSGFRGPGVAHRAVPGHEFGLDLSAEDKRALIAFLQTL
jgi:mono/diheme cytochrome c family protein